MATGPNPFVDPGPWGKVTVGGMDLPGIVTSIDGAEKPEEWTIQKATNASGATSVWKGTSLADKIKILLKTYDVDSFAGLYVIADVLRPKIGTKPPSLGIVSPVINFNKITRVSQALIGQPRWVESGAYWTLEITFTEYNPSKAANTGKAAPSKYKDNAQTANDKAAVELQKAVDQAAKL